MEGGERSNTGTILLGKDKTYGKKDGDDTKG